MEYISSLFSVSEDSSLRVSGSRAGWCDPVSTFGLGWLCEG